MSPPGAHPLQGWPATPGARSQPLQRAAAPAACARPALLVCMEKHLPCAGTAMAVSHSSTLGPREEERRQARTPADGQECTTAWRAAWTASLPAAVRTALHSLNFLCIHGLAAGSSLTVRSRPPTALAPSSRTGEWEHTPPPPTLACPPAPDPTYAPTAFSDPPPAPPAPNLLAAAPPWPSSASS